MSKNLTFKKIALIVLFLQLLQSGFSQVKFVIESLPNSTPTSDTLFVCGTFNDWLVNDQNYILKKQLNGKYAITLPSDTGSIEYKFSRGSWMKVETNANNEHTPNRIHEFNGEQIVSVKIENWLDLGGARRQDYMVYFLFAAALYGIILLLFVYRDKKRAPLKTRTFVLINSVLIISLFGGVFFNQANLIWKSNAALFGHVGLAIWGPLLFLFYTVLKNNKIPTGINRYFIPAIVVFFFSLFRWLNIDLKGFLNLSIGSPLVIGSLISMLIGILVTGYFLVICYAQFVRYAKGEEDLSSVEELIRRSFYVQASAYMLLIVNCLLVVFGNSSMMIQNYDVFFIILSTTIIIEFFYLWKYPEIIRGKAVTQFSLQNYDHLRAQLIELMDTQKPYVNPELNIGELSEMLETKSHILSKVLNEVFGKSFRDFINEYRINAFIRLAKKEEYSNFTYLALAHEVGFNSKSTFNLAFKKHTGSSPREFFKKSGKTKVSEN